MLVDFYVCKVLVKMPFTLRWIQCMVTSVLRDQQIMFFCKIFARGQESTVDEE